jgi:hypothetical protein
MPSARNHRADLLPAKGEIRRFGQQRGETAEATGTREPEAEACSGGADAGYAHQGRRSLSTNGASAGAQHILAAFGADCNLRRWGLKLAERGGKSGKKRAIIATARKLGMGSLLPQMYLSKFLQELVFITDAAQMCIAKLALDIPDPSRG